MNKESKISSDLKNLSNAIRILSADAIEKANSGHPGLPLGMADIMTVLAKDYLNFNPNDPRWPTRDRLILSAGHGSMLLYSFFYLAGFKDFTIDDIKNFRQLNSKTPGHPEYGDYPAIETTTGPLGQGFANAVGMAISQKKKYSKSKIYDYKIYVIVGDGCLMEGISYEAASIAGHLNLNNLIVIFDNNSISIDGKTSLTVSEDQSLKFKSLGFNVIEIDGHDYSEISNALRLSQNSDKPTFISCKTIIGYGAEGKESTEKVHGAPLGPETIKLLRQKLSWNDESFYVPENILKEWRNFWKKSEKKYNDTNNHIKDFPNITYNFRENLVKYLIDSRDLYFSQIITKESSRNSMGLFIKASQKKFEDLIVGSADLSVSNCIIDSESKIISKDNFEGNFIHFGVRENAMGAIMNGLSIDGFITICGTFFVFSDYMRPSIRLSALMGLDNIYIMTHDSIGVGEDGPTHQPVEHLASFRAMPNLYLIRPCNRIESYLYFIESIKIKSSPKIFALSRQNLLQNNSFTQEFDIIKGAYIFSETNNNLNPDVTIWSSGSEVQIALDVKFELERNHENLNIRVISAPCLEIFYEQDDKYKNILEKNNSLKIVIEAGVRQGWERVLGNDGMFFGVENFGKSAPFEEIFLSLGLSASKIYDIINSKFQNR